MNTLKDTFARITEVANSIGFSLIIGAVIYFIIGSVASLVGGKMLDWTFCSSAHHLFGVEWCGIASPTGGSGLKYIIHRLLNVPLPWLMIFWGFVLTALCSVLLKLLDQPYTPPGSKKLAD
ncbi:MAG: hypothetical protein WCD70_07680 [Alphaproteobacteria bacterium]